MTSIDLAALSRKELQALAKEFQLCRGNAKSDVILQHVERFVAENPADGEARVRVVLGGSASAVGDSKVEAAPLKNESPHEQPAQAATKASPKTEKSVTPRKDESASKRESVAKSIAAKKSPVKSDAAAKTKTPEKKTPEKKKAATAALAPTTSSPAPKKSPVKDASVTVAATAKSPAKESTASAKSGRPALASLDANAVKNKKQSKLTAASVESLVNSIVDLAFTGDGSRVRCSTTGHEMKADVDAIDAYIRGKSYLRAKLKKQSFASFAPMFVAHPDEKKTQLLWCSVTETEHPRDVARIEAHIAGLRYQKELPRWQAEEAARVQARQETEARAAAKAQARATKLQQAEVEAAKQRKQEKKSKSKGKRSRDNAAAEVEADVEAKRPRKKQAAKAK